MKTNIWSKPTIIFHWLLVVGMVGAYILAESEGLLNIHTAFGYMVGILLLFRIIWGFVGPRYSRFSDFTFSFKKLRAFFANMREEKKAYPGHNPLASWIMLGIILAGLVVTFSGIMMLIAKDQGFFASVNIAADGHMFEEMHEVSVNILILLVIIHILGLVINKVFHGDYGTLTSMFTGVKNMEGKNVKLNFFQLSFSWVLILVAIVAFAYTVGFQKIKEHEHGERHHHGYLMEQEGEHGD